MAEREKIKAIARKLSLISTQFSKGYGVYSLDPDVKGQYGEFLKDNNLSVSDSVGKKVFNLLDYFEANKNPDASKIKQAEAVISKWHTPLKKFDAMSADKKKKSGNSKGGLIDYRKTGLFK